MKKIMKFVATLVFFTLAKTILPLEVVFTLVFVFACLKVAKQLSRACLATSVHELKGFEVIFYFTFKCAKIVIVGLAKIFTLVLVPIIENAKRRIN